MKQTFAIYENGLLSKKVSAPLDASPSYVKRVAKVGKFAGVIADSASLSRKRAVRESTRPQ